MYIQMHDILTPVLYQKYPKINNKLSKVTFTLFQNIMVYDEAVKIKALHAFCLFVTWYAEDFSARSSYHQGHQ